MVFGIARDPLLHFSGVLVRADWRVKQQQQPCPSYSEYIYRTKINVHRTSKNVFSTFILRLLVPIIIWVTHNITPQTESGIRC